MGRFLSFVDRTSRLLSYVAAALLIVGVLAACYEVFARYVLSAPTLWVAELVQMLFGSIFLLCASENLRTRGHVSIDLLPDALSGRAAVVLMAGISILICAYAAVFLNVIWNRAVDSIRILETSNTPWNPPVWPLSLLLIVALAMMFLQALASLIRIVATGHDQAGISVRPASAKEDID